MISFASCDKLCNCDCCNQNGSDQTIQRPGNNNQGNNNDNNNNNGGNSGNEGNTGTVDTYNNTFTQGYAGYFGAYYEDLGQPSNTTNWYIELADDNYDMDNYEGDGYNIVFEIFANGTSSTSIPPGEYTVEAFDNNMFSAGSVMYGYIAEDDTYGEYPAGTWLYSGNDAIAGATSGWVQITASGSTYTITYELRDDEYQISFKGSYVGALEFYDGTETASYVSAAKVATKSRNGEQLRRFRVRR